MTLAKIARLAGTSVSTVSKAFSGNREISEETKEKIFAISKELGCFDKYYKAPRKNPLIAIMVPEIESEFYSTYAGAFESEFHRRGADTIIACTRFERERTERIFRELAYGMRVDGILMLCSAEYIKNPDEIPLVAFGSGNGASNADVIKADMDEALAELAKTIKEYGHTKVGFISEGLTTSKEAPFKRALRSAGLTVYPSYIATSSFRFDEAGEDCMRRLIERGSVPSVIVAAYNRIAYGAMKYAKEAGYRIPEDISFVGMDDAGEAESYDVPLSSIRISYEQIREQVADIIFKRIENRHYRSRKELRVPIRLVMRASLKNLSEGE